MAAKRDENELNYEWKYKTADPPKDFRYKGEVVLYYGPYRVQHSIRHFPNRLRGIKDLLVRDGYKVVCVPWEQYDRMAVLINDNIVFTCRYSYMNFDGFGQDYLTKELYQVIISALKRINAWYLWRNFKEKQSTDFFSTTIGK